MPQTRLTAFGGKSYMAANIVTDTNTPTNVALAFEPSIDRVRKARLVFDIAGVDGVEIVIEFHDEVFEELTVTGVRKEAP